MKTHILYIGLVLAAVALGTLAGSSLLAPAGVAVQPQDGKGAIDPAGVAIRPEGGKVGIAAPAPPGPAPEIQTQEIKLRHILQESILPAPSSDADCYVMLSMTKFSLAFTPDGKTLVGARNIADLKRQEMTGEVRLWDVATGKQRTSFPIEGAVRWFALSADGKTLAVVRWNNRAVQLWDLASGKERPFIAITQKLRDAPPVKERAFAEDFGSVAFTPDGKTLAVGGLATIKLWDVSTGKEKAGLKLKPVKVWDALPYPGKVRDSFEPCGPFCRVTFSPDGKLLAAVSDSAVTDPGKEIGEVTLWDLASGQQQDPLPDAGGGFSSVAFTPDGKTLAAGGAGIVLWDVTSGQQLATLKADQGKVESLAFTADGKTLASAGGPPYLVNSELLRERPSSNVRLWDMASGKVKATVKGFRSPPSYMVFAPDGRTLATFVLGEIKLWDVPAPKHADK